MWRTTAWAGQKATSRLRMRILVSVALVLLLTSCAAGANTGAGSGPDLAGFWLGLWHGVICPLAFIISLFNDRVGVYEIHNSGGWYNFGYVLGLSIIFSSTGHTSARVQRSPRRQSEVS